MKKNSHQIKITHVKGSGPGGQHRNKRMTGIEIKDLESGVTVRVTQRRSQTQNLTHAYERLEEKLDALRYKAPKRHATKPTKSSKKKRIETKKKWGEKKKIRTNKNWD